MKKYLFDTIVKLNQNLGSGYFLLDLHMETALGIDMAPGQFVEIKSPGKEPLLRRPISIFNYVKGSGVLSLLVRAVGDGTRQITRLKSGDVLNVVAPLGHGFTIPTVKRVLLIGGGVGIAPLLYLSRVLKTADNHVEVIYGARTHRELVALEKFRDIVDAIHACTDDGSYGFHGLVTQHDVAVNGNFDEIKCCGPMPMMKAVASLASFRKIPCEVSLENHMACGLGACLCCVEKTKKGNVCVCTDGPVFNINQLTW